MRWRRESCFWLCARSNQRPDAHYSPPLRRRNRPCVCGLGERDGVEKLQFSLMWPHRVFQLVEPAHTYSQAVFHRVQPVAIRLFSPSSAHKAPTCLFCCAWVNLCRYHAFPSCSKPAVFRKHSTEIHRRARAAGAWDCSDETLAVCRSGTTYIDCHKPLGCWFPCCVAVGPPPF